jgi:enoyl reductase-like protein
LDELLHVGERDEAEQVERQDEEEEREEEREVEVRGGLAEQRLQHALAEPLHDDLDDLRDAALREVAVRALRGRAGRDAARGDREHRERDHRGRHDRDDAELEVAETEEFAERGLLVEHVIERIATCREQRLDGVDHRSKLEGDAHVRLVLRRSNAGSVREICHDVAEHARRGETVPVVPERITRAAWGSILHSPTGTSAWSRCRRPG